MTYEEAMKHVLTVPWRVVRQDGMINVFIEPIEEIEAEDMDLRFYIALTDKLHAEHIVRLHNESLKICPT